MSKRIYLNRAAEQEATDVGRKYMSSTDVVRDMSRDYGADLSAVKIHTDDSAAAQAAEQGVDAFSTGRDVFFGRNVFSRSDPVSRGLLAHELSHSLQQGVGGDTGGMEHSVPMGAAQGGLRSWFRGLFGGNEEASTVPAENAAETEEGQETAAPDMSVQTAGRDSRQEMLSAANRLADAPKTGGRMNSDSYNAVISAVVRVTSVTGGNLDADPVASMKKVDEMAQCYRQLLAACGEYAGRTAVSSRGRTRKKLVLQIMGMAESDLAGLEDVRTDILGMSPEERTSVSWGQVLGRARAVRLTVEDFSALKKIGGQASENQMLTGQNATVRGPEGSTPLEGLKFFKREDSWDVEAAKGKGRYGATGVAWAEAQRRFPDLPDEDRACINNALEEYYNGLAYTNQEVYDQLSPYGKNAFKYFQMREKALATQVNDLMAPMGLTDEGGEINMTRRNVATSRMANLLGLGHLVARSQTAEIYDKKTGQIIRGNLMDQAAGEEFDTAAKKFAGIYKKKKGEEPRDSMNAFSGGFQKDLMNLQVLDVLCGQTDRHQSNMMYKFDEESGTLTGLQAFDNDASFGLNLDVVHAAYENRHDRRVYNEAGDMVLPYMDAALAERIEALSPEMVRYALKDLLRESEIEAAVARLQKMQGAIARARENTPEKLLQDDQWNRQTAQAVLDQHLALYNESKDYEFDRGDKKGVKAAMIEKRMLELEPDVMEKLIANKAGVGGQGQYDESILTREEGKRYARAKKIAMTEFLNGLARQFTANQTNLGQVMRAFKSKI